MIGNILIVYTYLYDCILHPSIRHIMHFYFSNKYCLYSNIVYCLHDMFLTIYSSDMVNSLTVVDSYEVMATKLLLK